MRDSEGWKIAGTVAAGLLLSVPILGMAGATTVQAALLALTPAGRRLRSDRIGLLGSDGFVTVPAFPPLRKTSRRRLWKTKIK
jgi:hypothetical protein